MLKYRKWAFWHLAFPTRTYDGIITEDKKIVDIKWAVESRDDSCVYSQMVLHVCICVGQLRYENIKRHRIFFDENFFRKMEMTLLLHRIGNISSVSRRQDKYLYTEAIKRFGNQLLALCSVPSKVRNCAIAQSNLTIWAVLSHSSALPTF